MPLAAKRFYPRSFPFRLGLIGFLAALLLVSARPAFAQDRATLDLLVKKGLISQAEADNIAKQAAVVVTPRQAAVKKLIFEALVQIQYDWLNTRDETPGAMNPPATNQFYIRRLHLGTIADLGHGWSSEVILDFATGPQMSAPPQSIPTQGGFEKAIISKVVPDYGAATFGYQKVQWVQEQNMPNSQLPTIERSIATNYFSGVYGGPTTGDPGFGGHRVGLFWNGTIPALAGFYYGAALTNGIQSALYFGNPPAGAPAFNQFAYWANAGYQGSAGPVTYRVGLDLGYASDANSTPVQNNAIYGYDPYITLYYGNFTLSAEFIETAIRNGRVNALGITSTSVPYGINITPSYKINDQWELVTRYSYLDTNGSGTMINNLVRNAQSTFNTVGYNDAWSLYAGVNWYIIGTSVKWSVDYEYDQFSGRETVAGGPFNGPRANVSGLRTQLQLRF
jgi:hypothetical protein